MGAAEGVLAQDGSGVLSEGRLGAPFPSSGLTAVPGPGTLVSPWPACRLTELGRWETRLPGRGAPHAAQAALPLAG